MTSLQNDGWKNRQEDIDDLSGGEGYKFEPQESNKEGEPLQKAFTRGNSCLSKKPSMTIGCMECGNNIKI